MTELYHVYLIEVDEMFKNAEAFIHYPSIEKWGRDRRRRKYLERCLR